MRSRQPVDSTWMATTMLVVTEARHGYPTAIRLADTNGRRGTLKVTEARCQLRQVTARRGTLKVTALRGESHLWLLMNTTVEVTRVELEITRVDLEVSRVELEVTTVEVTRVELEVTTVEVTTVELTTVELTTELEVTTVEVSTAELTRGGNRQSGVMEVSSRIDSRLT
eukprot:GHVO01058715.1.p2 GENE.GHVO01058715.1~~GHVO01058715.1.p2  ORF type:complete len:169 (-),score=18.86 GHVO01058715.1:432-938(-)